MTVMERGFIVDEDIARVRAATNLSTLFEEVTPVKRQGTRYVALCPFHSEHTPSMSINDQEGLYYCFGCQASGDAISFIRATKDLDFPEAVEYLADLAGISINYEETDEGRANRTRQRKLHEAIGAVSNWYQQQLLSLSIPTGKPGRDYLRSRGWNGEIVRRFGIGFAPANGDNAVTALHLPAEIAYESGIAYPDKNSGHPYDVMRGRVTFTIYDPANKPIAIAGRALPGQDETKKYLNFAETPLYQKRRVLYGLNWAKKNIAETDEVIVCEGYTDVISFHLAGIPRAVATCGVALTEEHVRLLSRFAKKILIAFDADSAGEGGVERVTQWQSRHGVEFYVVALPAGEDPASLVQANRSNELVQAVANARPLLGWQIDRLLKSADLLTPEGRVRTAEKAIGLINAHPNVLVREQYVSLVAERCQIDPARLESKHQGSRRVAEPKRTGVPKLIGPEFEAIRLFVKNQDLTRTWLIPQLLANPLALRILTALRQSDSLADAVNTAEPDVASVIAEMSMGDAIGDPEELRLQLTVAAALRAITRLALELGSMPDQEGYLLQVSTWLRNTASDANETGNPEAVDALWSWLAEQEDLRSEESTGKLLDTGETRHAKINITGQPEVSRAQHSHSEIGIANDAASYGDPDGPPWPPDEYDGDEDTE
jgi:DNA primase